LAKDLNYAYHSSHHKFYDAQVPEGKRQLGKLRHRWVGNIIVDFVEKGWSGVDWIDLAQDRDKW
jgi:hypothetical protein